MNHERNSTEQCSSPHRSSSSTFPRFVKTVLEMQPGDDGSIQINRNSPNVQMMLVWRVFHLQTVFSRERVGTRHGELTVPSRCRVTSVVQEHWRLSRQRTDVGRRPDSWDLSVSIRLWVYRGYSSKWRSGTSQRGHWMCEEWSLFRTDRYTGNVDRYWFLYEHRHTDSNKKRKQTFCTVSTLYRTRSVI